MPQPKTGKAGKEKKDPRKALTELTAQNEQLAQDLEKANVELSAVKQKWHVAVTAMMSCMDHRYDNL